MIENEFTFLVKKLPPNLEKYPHEKIKQGYISVGAESLRVRQKGKRYELTKKTQVKPGDFSRYNETTIYLSQDEFEKLWSLNIRYLEKTRYYYDLGNSLKAEIDVYEGRFKGYQTVEVEFPDEDSRKNFEVPDWFGHDITQLDWSSNSFLAASSFEEIKKYINELEDTKN